MNKKPIALGVLVALASSTFGLMANAGGVKYQDGDKYLKLGGRIQLQYHQANPDEGSSTDELYFRRLRPYIEGSLHKDWKGKFQWDMGKAEGSNELSVKDAYMAYTGLKRVKIMVGNYSFPFSREFLTSSKYQQFVERSFTGDHNFGTPDRQTGVHFKGDAAGKKLSWGAAVAIGAIDPDLSKLDFDTIANKNSDFNEGIMIGGRIDYHPFGFLKMSQGAFSRDQKLTIGLAAYNWNNDKDIDPANSNDVDTVSGLEVSGAYRIAGLSIDAQYNAFSADLVDGTLSGGLYKNGSTTLSNVMLKGGYMVMPKTLELVVGYQSQDADNYTTAWNRTSVGANWFLHKHDIKFQLSYRMGKNLKGVDGKDENELFVQSQYVF